MSLETNNITENKACSYFKIIMILAAVILLIIIARALNLQEYLHGYLKVIADSGMTGYAIFFAIYIIATLFMVPATILTLGAGAVFGVTTGTILVSVSSTVGATLAFLTGRYLARDMITRRALKNPTFKSMDEAVAREGWKIVGLTRLSPIFPFNLLNYFFGLTKVSLRDYFLASWICMLPGTVLYVYLGSLAGSLTEIGVSPAGNGRTTAEWILYGAGLITTVAVTVIVTRIARRALADRIPDKPDSVENQP